MKKIIIVALALATLLAMAGCSENTDYYNTQAISNIDKARDVVGTADESNSALNDMNNADLD